MSRLPLSALLLCLLLPAKGVLAQSNLGVAKYNKEGELLYPADLDSWIQTGASLGGQYGEKPFDPQNPGTIGVVQMEPAAYRYFMEHKSYADGTMFLLSFYQAESKSEPQLPGYVQGARVSQEIHVLDKSHAGFQQGHGFFIFSSPQARPSVLNTPGNPCVVCHTQHGGFDGTFAQFYPTLRAKLGLGK